MSEYVCASASISPKQHSDLHKIFCALPMSMARSSSGGVAIRYVLPVLWMMSYLYIMGNIERWRHVDTVVARYVIASWCGCVVSCTMRAPRLSESIMQAMPVGGGPIEHLFRVMFVKKIACRLVIVVFPC